MQYEILNLDGSSKGVAEFTDSTDPETLIDRAVTWSADEDGFHVIIGENLDSSPTQKTAKVVASQGILIFQNVLNPE